MRTPTGKPSRRIRLDELLEHSSLEESPSSNETSSTRSSTTTVAHSSPPLPGHQLGPIEWLRSTASIPTSLENLGRKCRVVLFTPVVPVNPLSTECMDPFEHLGRAVEHYHNNVQHVPYIPNHGFTEYHKHFLEQKHLGAVFVVVYNAAGENSRKDIFAKQTAAHLRGSRVPRILILVDDISDRMLCLHTEHDQVEFGGIVLLRSYSPLVLARLADFLFGNS